jgi:hypothetical protein
MRKSLLLINILLVGFCQWSWSQEFAASGIPDSLRNGAHAVIRKNILEITINNAQQYTYAEEVVVTILDKTGEAEGDIQIIADTDEKVKLDYGRVYDSRGVQTKNTDVSTLTKNLLISTGTAIHENRALYQMELRGKSYPYTCVYRYEHTVNGTMNIVDWKPVDETHVSCMRGKVNVKYKNGLNMHFKADEQLKAMPCEEGKKYRTCSWELNGLKAIKKKQDIIHLPMVRTVLNEFELKGNKGLQSNWGEFGDFIYGLNESQYQLTDELKKLIHDSADKYSSPHQKIESLYTYLQSEYRYVLVSIGMGGWKPQSTAYTFDKGFGDCKALTLLMQTMLKEVDIEAYYCLVQAGDDLEPIDPEFAENRFNHAIVCAVVEGKNIWLECTSKTLKAGNLGDFAGNKNALLIDKNNSRLVKTSSGKEE